MAGWRLHAASDLIALTTGLRARSLKTTVGLSTGQKFVAGVAEHVQGLGQEAFFDQDVIGVIGGDGEDGDGVGTERSDERGENSGLGKSEWTLEFEADPSGVGFDSGGDAGLRADNREFLVGVCDRKKMSVGPGRDRFGSRQLTDGEEAGE